LAPENFTALAHFSVSSAMSFPKSAAEPGLGKHVGDHKNPCEAHSSKRSSLRYRPPLHTPTAATVLIQIVAQQAMDEREAIEKATEQFKAPATKLMARPISDSCSPRGEPSRNTEAGILLTEHVTEDAPRSSPMLAGLAPTGSRVLVGAPVQRTKGTRCLIPGLAHMPMEFLHGRPLSPEDLERIRQEIEAFDNIDVIDDEIRGIVARNWPYLLEKLPPDED
jgi:hypothetical protein